MKFISIIFLCFLFALNVCGQSTSGGKTAAVGINEILLARDDGRGKAGEICENFTTTDVPIHFLIQLNSVEPVTVKMNLIAVKVAGMKPETKSIAVSFTTDGTQNQVSFDASPNGAWAAGNYRADVFINGKLSDSRAFDIGQSLRETAAQKPVTVKTFVSRKKSRKN
ncbi:MAG: hypothetical protein M3T96_06515 [Acidobacteriota bacterium]|nr:hypothetical protein [Acidobacteriota bacterium]